jgi:tetratricopeptide (TPR) repeat protein
MGDFFSGADEINFGDVPDAVNALLQQGVIAYRRDAHEADRLFRKALEADPSSLPTYYCLYKIHTYQGDLDKALEAATRGLMVAAGQAGWDVDWRAWRPSDAPPDSAGRFALYTLKALAFIHLRRNERRQALELLAALQRLDPSGAVGWPVVAALAEGVS